VPCRGFLFTVSVVCGAVERVVLLGVAHCVSYHWRCSIPEGLNVMLAPRLSQYGQVSFSDGHVGCGVGGLHKDLSHVMRYVVLLRGSECRPWWHQPEAVSECLIHPKQVSSVLKWFFPEGSREGQVSLLLWSAVAGGAKTGVQFLSAL